MEASVDIGNSRIKVGVFQEGSITAHSIQDEASVINYLNSWEVSRLIVSSVAGKEELVASFKANFNYVLEFNRTTALPIKISYATPETLGLDRLAAAAGALRHHAAPILVIDAGTCITCDLVDEPQVFVGGSISPGLQMRLQAMHTFTRNLPLLELARPSKGVPASTGQAMLAGAVTGAKHELIGFINEYRTIYPEIKVILCGGDAKYFDKMNELNIFVLPNLVLEGLNAILRFNEEA